LGEGTQETQGTKGGGQARVPVRDCHLKESVFAVSQICSLSGSVR